MSVIYDFTAQDLLGNTVNFADFTGKVLLIVNTASECGFTPQFAGLQALHERYSDQGLVVIGFPCNQFGKQEPNDGAAIGEFCQRNYGVEFLMIQKIDVNGEHAHPIFAFRVAVTDKVELCKKFDKFMIKFITY